MMNLFLSYIIFFSCNFFALNAFDSVSKRRIFRIVGGYPTSIEQNPYMVCILREGSMHCGGTLVKSDVVLTAAHCVYSQEEWMNTRTLTAYPARDITVLIGSSYSKSTNDENALLRNVTEVIGHEYFEFSYMQNDIALLKLSQPVDISRKVQLVKLIANRPAIGTVCTALGWGISKSFAAHETPTGPSAEVLYEVDLSVISLSDCGKTMPKVTYQSICTYTPGKDACVGDSGGPLMCSGYQAGIISYGIGCAAKYKPGVFQRIDIHFKWLRAHGSAPSQQRPLPVPLALLLSLPAAAPLTTVLCF